MSCSGDPIQCAILEQQYLQRCASEEAGEFESPDFSQSQIESALGIGEGDSDFSDTVEEADVSGIFDDVVSQTGQGATCPADLSLDLAIGTIPVSLQPLCDLAEMLGILLLILASLVSFKIVQSGFDG